MKADYMELLRGAKSRPFEVDAQGWAWINGNPISPTIVQAWIAAGLIENYREGEKIVSQKGRKVLERGIAKEARAA